LVCSACVLAQLEEVAVLDQTVWAVVALVGVSYPVSCVEAGQVGGIEEVVEGVCDRVIRSSWVEKVVAHGETLVLQEVVSTLVVLILVLMIRKGRYYTFLHHKVDP